MGGRNFVRMAETGLVDSNEFDMVAGSPMKAIPILANTGAFEVGNGTKNFDVKIWGADSSYFEIDASAKTVELSGMTLVSDSSLTSDSLVVSDISLTGTLTPSGDGWEAKKITVITANSVLDETHFSALVVQNRAGFTVLTLPAPSASNAGATIDFVSVQDQDCRFTSPGKIIVLNDVTADSVTANTASEKLGSQCRFISAASKWVFQPILGTWTTST